MHGAQDDAMDKSKRWKKKRRREDRPPPTSDRQTELNDPAKRMEPSLCTPHATVTAANAAPLSVRAHRGARRARAAVRAHSHHQGAGAGAGAREPEPEPADPQGAVPAKGRGPPALPNAALRVGAGVALALALGGVSWTARGGSAGAGPVTQPAMVCALNAVTDAAAVRASAEQRGAATMKTSVDALSDSLFRREDSPRDRATLMDLVFEQVTKEVWSFLAS
jgi:hypothetical protein